MMSYRKQYIPFRTDLQLLKKIKFMSALSTDDYQTYHGHTDIRFFSWISWEDH